MSCGNRPGSKRGLQSMSTVSRNLDRMRPRTVWRVRIWTIGAIAIVLIAAGCSNTKTNATSGTTSKDTKSLTFTAQTLDGATVDTASTIGKRPLAFWVWAPWCPTCNQEAPTVKAAFTKYQDRVQFIGVAGRDRQSEMRKFTERHELTAMTQAVSEDGALWSQLGVPGQPAWVFVSADSAVDRHIGPIDQAALFKKLDTLSQ